MKSQIHAVFGKLILGAFFLLTFAMADAQGIQSGAQPKDTAAVSYLGSDEDMIVFNVSYPNPEGNKFQVIIRDQDGAQLYHDYFSARSFYRQFRLPKGDKQKIAFVIRDKSGAETVKTFEVNVNSRYIREVAVKKIY